MLQDQIESLFDAPPAVYIAEHHALFASFKHSLNRGTIRAAEPDTSSPTGWRTNAWVKKGILLGFRMGSIVDMSVDAAKLPFFDKSTYPLHSFSTADGVRIVPGGSSIRDGAHIARGVICMPPMFVNVGAFVGENTMIDSHALIGSCAQVGRNCHISAGSQIGGVLEPVGALPVIIEDDVLVGGNSGIYEGTIVKRRAVLGTGAILNRSIPVYDLVRDTVYSATDDQPLVIPEDAVVIPGSRAVSHPAGKKWGLSLSCAVIVKYRDAKTGSRIQLEDFLR
jgi:2,3,4,5-tetrahydropyridine-2,6-dicarboxylate N-succinyltransferase